MLRPSRAVGAPVEPATCIPAVEHEHHAVRALRLVVVGRAIGAEPRPLPSRGPCTGRARGPIRRQDEIGWRSGFSRATRLFAGKSFPDTHATQPSEGRLRPAVIN